MKKLMIVGMAVSLTACEPLLPPMIQNGTTTSAVQHSVSSETASGSLTDAELEYGDGEAAPVSPAPVLPEEVLTERLLPSGALELGNPNAPVTLSVFTHHSCEYCRTFTDKELPRLITDFVNKGQLKIEIMPLNLKKYPISALQEKMFICSGKIGRGLDTHRTLFWMNLTGKTPEATMAKELKVDAKAYAACVASAETEAMRAALQDVLQKAEITLVPTLMLQGELYVGLMNYADLRGKIEAVLTQ